MTFLAVTALGSQVSWGATNDTVLVAENIKLTTYVGDAAVNAFGVAGTHLWYATEDGVFSLGLTQKKLDEFQRVGDLDAGGVNDILVAKDGSVWFAANGGVAVRKGGRFQTYTEENGLPGKECFALDQGKDGAIWVGTDKGAAVYRNGNWESFTKENGLVGNKINDIVADSKGAVWFGTNRGISQYVNGSWVKHDMKSGLSWNETTALAYDSRKNILWAAVNNGDANSYNGETWRVYMSVGENIQGIMPDTRSRIWFGGAEGVVKFNGEEWVEDAKRHGIPMTTQTTDMYCDSDGNLWFAGVQGVMMLTNPYPF